MNEMTNSNIAAPSPSVYNKAHPEALCNIIGETVLSYLRAMNLDNGIEASSDFTAQTKGYEAMNQRRKLVINGTSQWISYSSVQELVNIVTAETLAAQRMSVVLFKDYMLDWYHKYKEPKVGHNYRNNCVCQMRNHIFPYIGDIPISDITVHDV